MAHRGESDWETSQEEVDEDNQKENDEDEDEDKEEKYSLMHGKVKCFKCFCHYPLNIFRSMTELYIYTVYFKYGCRYHAFDCTYTQTRHEHHFICYQHILLRDIIVSNTIHGFYAFLF